MLEIGSIARTRSTLETFSWSSPFAFPRCLDPQWNSGLSKLKGFKRTIGWDAVRGSENQKSAEVFHLCGLSNSPPERDRPFLPHAESTGVHRVSKHSSWDRSALVARLCQKPLEQPWSQCWASRRSRELGLSHVFNIHLGMLRNSFQLQDSGITWAILSQRSIRNMFYLILIASRSWAHRQLLSRDKPLCEMVIRLSGSCHGPYWMCHPVLFLVVAGSCRGEPRGPLGLCSSGPFRFLSKEV